MTRKLSRLLVACGCLLLVTSTLTASPASAAAPRCAGRVATLVGTSGDDVLIGTRRADVIVALGGADEIRGRGGGDVICGSGGDDFVSGDGGPDRLVGGGGSDILSGVGGPDSLVGGNGVDVLAGGAGDDGYDGGGDLDLAAFLASSEPVIADLLYGSASGEGSDSLAGIEVLYGSDFDDILFGDEGSNAFFGGPGDDSFFGEGGGDYVAYSLEQTGMQINLAEGWATDGLETDDLYSIENAIGTPFDDALSGGPGANFLMGEEGFDYVNGDGDGDICYGESVAGCIEQLPSTSEPPADVSERVTSSQTEGRRLQSIRAPRRAAAAFNGNLSCPMLTGSAVMTYPSWTGYGYWAWRYSYPWPVGAWNYGPWLYFDGSQWIAYFQGQWFNVSNQASWPGGHSTAIEAWYYHYDSGSWYEIGECFTQTTHLIPGLVITPG